MLRGRFSAIAAIAAVLCTAQPALPQDNPITAPAIDAPSECELHVWPGRSFHAVYYGWTHGGTINGAAKGRKGYPALPDQPLATDVQRTELAKLDLPKVLGLSGYRTVLHDEALTAAAIRTTAGRQVAESAPCYAELMVDDIVFQNHVINGKWLNVILRFRQFDGTGPVPIRSYGTYVLQRTALFPPPDADTDPAPALEELRSAFARSVTGFGDQYAAFLKRNGKKKGASITL